MIDNLEKHLAKAIEKHKVPGASVAVLQGDNPIVSASAGLINLDTKAPVLNDTLFQIGSITKTMTATMIMQLQEEGKLKLEDKLLLHLPKLKYKDERLLNKVTLQHLLNHSSGIDGDFFVDTDTGKTAIRELITKSKRVPFLFEPGKYFSYSNLGYVILGRLIEVLDGRPFEDSLQARVFDPLEMKHAISKLIDIPRFSVAVGHVPGATGDDNLQVAKSAFLSIGMKSAGSTTAMTAENLIRFAAAHMSNGLGLNGKRLLSATSAKQMLKLQPAYGGRKQLDRRVQIGLSWYLMKWGEDKVFAHEGSTNGQEAQLIVCPEKNIAIATLTNGGNAQGVFKDVAGKLLKSLEDIVVLGPEEVNKNVKPVTQDLVGVYQNLDSRIEVTGEDRWVMISSQTKISGKFGQKSQDYPIGFVEPRYGRVGDTLIEFGGKAKKKAEWVRVGFRLLPRVQ